MRPFLSLLLSGAVLSILPPAPGNPTVQDPGPKLSKAARAVNKKLEAQMQGAWRLVDMRLVPEMTKFGQGLSLEHVGYCLVSGGYLSIEFHLRLVDKGQQDRGQSLVTGLHRFELDGTGWMDTTTVIATNTRRNGVPEFEPPGTKRRYEVSFPGDRMVLVRDDGHRLVFEKLRDGRQEHDIFGRPVRKEPSDDEAERRETDGPEGGEKKDGG